MVDENQPSMKWKMARIHETHPGPDGVVRVVTLRTATGFLRRPITKICLLPIPAETIEEEKAETAEIRRFQGGSECLESEGPSDDVDREF